MPALSGAFRVRMACPALALRPPSPGVPKRAATARRQALTQVGPVTHSDQVTLGDQVASIDTEDYISGKPTASFIGKLVSWTVPPPVRFFATWLAPSICLVSLFPQAVLGVVVAVLAALQASVPVISPVVNALSFSWLPTAALLFLRCSPLLYAYLGIPIVDCILGEEEEPALKVSPTTWYKPLYRFVSQAFVLLYAATLLGSAYVVTQPTCSPALFALLLLNVGTTGGFAFAVAHELVHSRHSFDRACADVLLTLVCYKQWSLSHIAHHAQVATPADPASARYKESVYPFVLRSIKGEWADALRLEWQRVSRTHPGASKLQRVFSSKIPGWFLWPAATAAVLWAAFGPPATAFFLIQGVLATCLLEVINYVEHYGLCREQLPNGQFERVSEEHSWNANHMLSNAVLLRLQRHTDHHMHSTKPYHELESIEGAPKLPASYPAMLLLALVPPMWFCVMNPRVHMHRLLADVQRKGRAPGGKAAAVAA